MNRAACNFNGFCLHCLGMVFLYVLLTVHLSIILDNDQLDTHLLYFTIRLLQPSTYFERYMLIIRRLNCIDAATGIVTLSQWPIFRALYAHHQEAELY